VVQNSIREGFCLALTEALWKGKPIVATNVGGIPIQIRDCEEGFLVEPHQRGEFAEKIIEILNNPSLGKEMGEKGKERVRENFLITRLLSDYLDLKVKRGSERIFS
jgi:trehalose synthase